MPHDDEQRTWSCLPITSVTLISVSSQNLLASGQGPVIKIHHLSTGKILLRKKVFEFQSIHGIKVQNTSDEQTQVNSLLLLVWGGRLVTLARLHFSYGQSPDLSLLVGPEIEVVDWIFDATFAAPTSGPSTVAYVVTAHNDVFSLKKESSHGLEHSVSQVTSGPNSILYSAQIKPLSATRILVAAGTVFGEIIVWTCYRSIDTETDLEAVWRGRVYSVFRGHNGSIFGVCLSDPVALEHNHRRRFLASCSDDRTIRVWDVSDCDHIPESGVDIGDHNVEGRQETILTSIEQPSIAATWGHLSRIWGVEFMYPQSSSSTDSLHLISRGEDATCQIWELAIEGSASSTAEADLRLCQLKFTNLSTDYYHAGKHIWSLAQFSEESYRMIITGGGDGGLIARTVTMQKAASFKPKMEIPFCHIFESLVPNLPKNGSKLPKDNDTIKQYAFVSSDTVLATTNGGRLLKGVVHGNEEKRCQPLSMSWVLLFHAAEFKEFSVMSSDTIKKVVYIGSAAGNLWIYQHSSASFHLLATVEGRISNIFTGTLSSSDEEDAKRHLLIHSNDSLTAKLLQVAYLNRDPYSVRVLQIIQLSLPPTFQTTAFLQIFQGNHVVIGSRSGALAIYQGVLDREEVAQEITPALCIRRVHGSDSVTDLQHLHTLNESGRNATYCDIVSTGRDGSFAIHRIHFPDHDGRSTAPSLTTLHRSCPPFGSNIEGIDVLRTNSSSTELVIHGFDGKDFIVWNESANSEVMRVTCGGPHRSWAYVSNSSSPPTEKHLFGGQFLWTKARVFNMAKFQKPAQRIIQPRGHGREIKAIALHDQFFDHTAPGMTRTRLIATGAEDTTIRLWEIRTSEDRATVGTQTSSTGDSATCVRIMKKHTTGIQHLSFCKDFLFSSAGCEELYIWKINFGVSGVGFGTFFQTALPKTATSSDLRITNFEVACVSGGKQADSTAEVEQFVIYAAYSNSMVRIFRYANHGSLPSDERFHLLAQGFYNTTCLTNLCRLPEPSHWFLTASTNGAVAAWPEISHHIDTPFTPIKLSNVSEHRIHQNAILALDIIPLEPQYYLLLTGGDDNALGLTIITESNHSPSSSASTNTQSPPRFATLLIPKAHAAAITAIEMLDLKTQAGFTTFTIVSSGCDQRLKVWRIVVNMDELVRIDSSDLSGDAFGPRAVSAIDVQMLKAMWTSVADVSNVLFIPDAQDHPPDADVKEIGQYQEPRSGIRKGKRLMVVGIGMEMFKIGGVDEDEELKHRLMLLDSLKPPTVIELDEEQQQQQLMLLESLGRPATKVDCSFTIDGRWR